MDTLEKIQKLPLKTRKIIVWLVIIILALFFLNLWVKSIAQRLSG